MPLMAPTTLEAITIYPTRINQAIPRHCLPCLLLTNIGWDRHILVSL